MLAIRYRFNYAIRTLLQDTPETIGILTRSGATKYVTWQGFININIIRFFQGKTVPVKLVVDSVYIQKQGEKSINDWVKLKPGEYVQGCYLQDFGVAFAVVESDMPRIISKTISNIQA